MEVFYGLKCQKTFLIHERIISREMIEFLYILLTEIKYFAFEKDSVILCNIQPEEMNPHLLSVTLILEESNVSHLQQMYCLNLVPSSSLEPSARAMH